MQLRSPARFAVAAAMLAAAAPAAPVQPAAATLLAAQSEIDFTTRQMGVPVAGRFGRFSAAIAFDPRQPASSSVSVSIDTGSARFGAPELDAEVGKTEWLDVGRFGRASFESAAIKAAGPGRFEVAGKLTIKGASQDIVVPVQLTQAGGTSVASGSFTIKRLEFKVGTGEWTDTSILADEVGVHFRLVLDGVPPL